MTDKTDKSTKDGEMSREQKIAKLAEMIKKVKMAMLTTADADGRLRSRPMATLENDFDGSIYFFTREHSGKVESLKNDQQVNVAYSKPESQLYVSVTGRGSVTKERAQLEKFWNPAMKAWFPEGLEDPEVALITIEVDSAEFWDSPPNKLVQLVGFIEAIATGKPYDEIHKGHDQRIDLNSRH